jgi:HlyD family secretion protein
MTNKFISALIGISGLLAACHSAKREVRAELRPLSEAVYASGTLVPENEYKVVSTVEGYLQKSWVKEGDTVRKGQALFNLTNDNQLAQVAAASRLVSKTLPVAAPDAPSIRDLESRLASARIRRQNDSLDFARYERLFQQHAVSASSFEKYKLSFETSVHEVTSLESQLGQQRLAAGLQLQEADNQLELAITSKSNGLLRSYTDGVVYDIYKQNGDLVGSGQPLALIGSGPMLARLLVDEDDLAKVRTGQEVLITLDAIPDRIFHARIRKIYPMLNKQEQSFRVDALFTDSLPRKLYGLNVEANIVLGKTQALVIPREALRKGDSVAIQKDGKIALIRIRKGVEDQQFIQVLEGLDPDARIIIEK